jgi:transcriptional regulator with XRE-family HTH domain
MPAIAGMEIKETFARNLKAIRRARGLSQEELAHRAGIDRTYISALERSVYNASIDVVDRLAKELGVEAPDLLKRPTGAGSSGSKGQGG